jgi:hypothetical protein
VNLYEGDSLHIAYTLAQSIEVQKATRAMRPRRSHGQVHFTIFCNIDVLNNFQFRIGANIVGIFPGAKQPCHSPLKRHVLPAHGQPSVVVLHQGFGFIEAHFS